MSDELEARMWDEGGSRYEARSRGAYYESAFASSEQMDRAPLLAEVSTVNDCTKENRRYNFVSSVLI